MANRVTSLVSISALIISTSSAANATCYYPNGVENHGGACRPDAEVSACCGPSFVCLSNQLCAVGPDTRRTYAYKYYRSGCTDPYWNSSSCSQVCTEREYVKNMFKLIKLISDQRNITLEAVRAYKAVATMNTAVLRITTAVPIPLAYFLWMLARSSLQYQVWETLRAVQQQHPIPHPPQRMIPVQAETATQWLLVLVWAWD